MSIIKEKSLKGSFPENYFLAKVGDLYKLIFQDLLSDNKLIKMHLVKFPKKILLLAKWTILAQWWPKIMQVFMFWIHSRDFFKLCSMI